MSLQSVLMKITASAKDRKRDSLIPLPLGITECRNISYESHGKWSLLDVYYPENTAAPLPTIVSIHGGGYVYGSKELYRRYGMDMARRGFAFVNFNYRLAPKWKFPAPLWDTNAVMNWICANAARYHLDPQRIILIGDSAGAQLASQYAAIVTNPVYAAKFHMAVPSITIRALGLNCGMYDPAEFLQGRRRGIVLDYLGRDISADDPRLDVMSAIDRRYPPTFLTTACHDYLREHAQPMQEFLSGRGLRAEWKCYGTREDRSVGHVFHITVPHPEAIRCNDDSAAFFRDCLEDFVG